MCVNVTVDPNVANYQQQMLPDLQHTLKGLSKHFPEKWIQAEMYFLRKVGWRSLREEEKLGHSGGARVEPLLLRTCSGYLPREVFSACPSGRRP